MNIFEYLKHINGDDEKNDNDSSTNDDIEDKIDSLEELMDNTKEIKYQKLGKFLLINNLFQLQILNNE